MINERYLFRGKRLDNSRFAEGSLRSWTIDGQMGKYGNQIIIESGLAYYVDPATIGQCTGLKDANGRLIFEGDILKSEIDGEIYHDPVLWHISGWVADFGDDYEFLDVYVNEFKSKIIGNIHDNPELLKGEELKANDKI